ncbi:MAG: alanine racemase, partial [Clostridia bacterium]
MCTKRTWAEIDLSAVRNNFMAISEYAKRPIIAVVKADAYGHGAAQLARIYEELGACMLAVATVSEADDLRASGISGDILIFGRTAPCDIRAGYVQAVFSLEYAREL